MTIRFLSAGFLTSPWALGALALMLVSSHTGAYLKGRTDAGAKCDVAALRDENGQLKITLSLLRAEVAADRAALEKANQRAAIAAIKIIDMERTSDALAAEFAAREALCPVGDDDARRLRNLR